MRFGMSKNRGFGILIVPETERAQVEVSRAYGGVAIVSDRLMQIAQRIDQEWITASFQGSSYGYEETKTCCYINDFGDFARVSSVWRSDDTGKEVSSYVKDITFVSPTLGRLEDVVISFDLPFDRTQFKKPDD